MSQPPSPPNASTADAADGSLRAANKHPPRSGFIPPKQSSATSEPSSSTSRDTLFCYNTQATKEYAAIDRANRDKEYRHHTSAMKEHVAGPVPVEALFKEHMAVDETKLKDRTEFPKLSESDVRSDSRLAEIITGSGVCGEFELRDTTSKFIQTPLTKHSRAPDLTLGDYEAVVERKNEDIFIDPPEGADRSTHVFLKTSDAATAAFGQMIAYVEAGFEMQPRTHMFSLAILGDTARLFRWDHGGCVVSEAFSLYETTYLFEFFDRYRLMSDAARGHDPSVTLHIEPETVAKAKSLLQANGGTVDEGNEEHFRLVEFPNEHGTSIDGKPSVMRLIATRPRFFKHGVEGVATRGGLAVLLDPDESQSKVVFLKDTWRYDDPDADSDIEKEGKIYESLHDAGVQHIAQHLGSGDAAGDFQQTQTDRYLRQSCSGVTLYRYRHYYTVLDTIGRPLTSYISLREMTDAVLDAFVAHRQAFEKAKILHRDISPGNILITKDGGVLIDWQLAKRIGQKPRRPRTHGIVGTWQFQSYGLQGPRGKLTQDLRDDLESFVYVLLYTTARYRPLKHNPTDTLWYMYLTFDVAMPAAQRDGPLRYRCGAEKVAFLRGQDSSFGEDALFADVIPLPLWKLFTALRDIFAPLYPLSRYDSAQAKRIKQDIDEMDMPDLPFSWLDGKSSAERSAQMARWEKEWEEHTPDDWRERLLQAELAAIPEPQVDYSQVENHTAVHKAIVNALASRKWANDGPAVDQLSTLRREYRGFASSISPQEMPASMRSSASRTAGSTTSALKRQADSGAEEHNSKRRRTDDAITSGLSLSRRETLPRAAKEPKEAQELEEAQEFEEVKRDWQLGLQEREEDAANAEKAGTIEIRRGYRKPKAVAVEDEDEAGPGSSEDEATNDKDKSGNYRGR